jgi:probable O-glycosylation ligase (exosortase A-associated)
MRDIFLIIIVAISLGFTLRYPFVGVLIWEWFAMMAPHQGAYGFSRSLPLNLVIAITTIGSWLASKEPKRIPSNSITILFIVFLIWMTFNSFFAYSPSWSWPFWDRTWRVFALGFMIAAMATNRVRIEAIIWVAVISLLYFGVKGGLFTLLTGGSYKVFGPDSTIISDNNQLALALLMCLPLVEYLRSTTPSKLLSWTLVACIILTVIAVLGSYSRGAYIALGAIALVYLMYTKKRFTYLAAICLVIVPALFFMPESFYDRLGTLNSVNSVSEDSSFHGRWVAWQVAIRYATDHFPFGAGFYGPQLEGVFNRYFPHETAHAAHSIYFQVLGEHGYIGFLIYLAIIFVALRYCSRIARNRSGEVEWSPRLARAIQVSLIGFFVGGAALSMAYYDLFVILVFLLPQIPQSATYRQTSHTKWRANSLENLKNAIEPRPYSGHDLPA